MLLKELLSVVLLIGSVFFAISAPHIANIDWISTFQIHLLLCLLGMMYLGAQWRVQKCTES